MNPPHLLRLSSLVLSFVVMVSLSACTDSTPQVDLPPGTPVSGDVKTPDLLQIVYLSKEDETPHVIPVRDDGKTITYRSAVPPGDYTVYAYITGARAKIKEVTVGEEPLTLDIPETLEFEEATDDLSGV